MKSLRILSGIAGVLVSLLSPQLIACDEWCGHFVAGVDVGYESRSGHINLNLANTAGTVTGAKSQKLADSGTIYGLLGGYQLWYKNWFGGLEGHVDFNRYENARRFVTQLTALGTLNSEAQHIQHNRYGVTARLGLNVPPFFMPYIKGGAEYSKNTINVAVVGVDQFAYNKNHWAWIVGLGVEVPFFSEKTSLRLEYNYKQSSRFTWTDSLDTLRGTHTYKPHVHQAKFAWTWNFI